MYIRKLRMYIRKLRMYIRNLRLYIRNLRIYFMCEGKEVYVRPPPGLPGEPRSFHLVPSRTAGHDESRARRQVWWKSAGAGDSLVAGCVRDY